ncbi:MAG: tetratricopeptide repeat protein, partial [Anaerolineae bacterium]|nr:tetratricopeptide repeat protein [Anaerolineae bacterium]
ALRFIGALGFFWTTQGYSAEGNRWGKEVLAKAKSVSDQDDNLTDQQLNIRAKALLSMSRMATDLGDNETTRSVASESVDLARKTGNKQILSFALANLASGKANLGEGDEAYKLVEEALALARAQGVSPALGFSLVMMGQLKAMAQQDYEGALAYGEEAIAVSEAGGNRWGSAMTTFGLGFFARTLGDYEQARARFRTCLPVFLELGDKHRINMIQSELAHIERELSQYEQAIPMYREAILEWQRLGHRAAVANQLECFAFIAKAQEQPERAAKLLGAAEVLREKINIQMTDIERVEYNRQIAELKANMDDKDCISLWGEGRAMTMEQAIELALNNG